MAERKQIDWEAIERAEGSHRFYVYELVDPRDGKPFYVGKGTKDRARTHLRHAAKGCEGSRFDRIREIEASGNCVIVRCVQSGMAELDALELEERRIAEIGIENLCNAYARGCMSGQVRYGTSPEYRTVRSLWFTVDDLVVPAPGRWREGDFRYDICAKQHYDVMFMAKLAENVFGKAAIVAAERLLLSHVGDDE